MHTFKIENECFVPHPTVQDELHIESHPNSYVATFEQYDFIFSDKDFVLVDRNVKELYNVNHDNLIAIDAVEENKSIETVLSISDKLLEFGFDKSNHLIVIGGGIIQDIGAFTAKTFKRGITWTFVPTTLLSQCDSCIGGKTALNFKNYKNQLALFSAPSTVIIDTSFLSTLSENDIASGHGEIVKLFLMGGDYYIDRLNDFNMKEKIFHSLAIKKTVIEKDEFESFYRKSLNYGHSFGHAIEAVTNYSISHGIAVLLGMEIINNLFNHNSTISSVISSFVSMDALKNIDPNALFEIVKTDKKVKDGYIDFIVVPEIGTTEFKQTRLSNTLKEKLYAIFPD